MGKPQIRNPKPLILIFHYFHPINFGSMAYICNIIFARFVNIPTLFKRNCIDKSHKTMLAIYSHGIEYITILYYSDMWNNLVLLSPILWVNTPRRRSSTFFDPVDSLLNIDNNKKDKEKWKVWTLSKGSSSLVFFSLCEFIMFCLILWMEFCINDPTCFDFLWLVLFTFLWRCF